MESSLIEYFIVVKKYWKFIVITTFSMALLTAFVVFFVISPIFVSSSTVKSVGKSGSAFGGLLSSSGLSDISGLEDLSGGGSSKDLALLEEILTSRRCIEGVIDKFDLMTDYNEKYKEKCIKKFRDEILEISKNTKSGILEIKIYDKSPQKAKDMNEYMISLLNKINTEINVQYAKNNREFIETRYNNIKSELRDAEDSLRFYQDKFGLAPDITTKSIVSATVNLESEIRSEEIKLDLLKKIYSDDQVEVKSQQTKIELLKKNLEEIRNSSGGDFSYTLKDAPAKVMNYLRLTREVEIKNKILAYIVPVFEQAKIEEKKEVPSVVVLDYPDLPYLKTKPKRLLITILSMLITFVILSISTIFYEMYIKKILYEYEKRKKLKD